jgi:uncharacterized protein YyaL (SSP411 family)
MSASPRHKHTNRLAHETSPYLLQHAHNPVDWYAWGPEAFEAARAQDKPIFLSVGYSTCYWCHVMERQSFENEAIAEQMNRDFICIKVDREERPDVDQLYMTAVQLMTRQGGWPMSVWLTPDLRPFYGGTYFPPQDAYGRPGFSTVLDALAGAWRERRQEIEKTAAQLAEMLAQASGPGARGGAVRIDRTFIDRLIERSTADYESQFGGFGFAPKFPRQTLLEMLLHANAQRRDAKIDEMLEHTLDAMAAGGIRDHLGGGFHRYSTDAQWLVPHFEIMLYDNAMLAYVYAEASRLYGRVEWAEVARGVLDFVLREMRSPEGAFYTAFDAEVDAQEGLSYLWTKEEIEQILGPDDARLFNRVYGVDSGPNFADPHHGTGRPDRSILYLPRPIEASATQLGIDPAELRRRLGEMRAKLKAARDRRKQPLLDTKIITSWNALMIRALAFGGRVLGEPRYTEAAAAGAAFLMREHRTGDGGLNRTSRGGVKKYLGFLDDYAFLADALLELDMRPEAEAIVEEMIRRFGDPAGGFFFTDASATDLIVRQKTATDSPLPSGNAVAARVLMRMGRDEPARQTIATFAHQLDHWGEGMSSMVQAAGEWLKNHDAIDVAGDVEAGGPADVREEAEEVVSFSAARQEEEIKLLLKIAPGMHINGPEMIEGMVPTMVTVVDAPAARVEYPPPIERKFAFDDRPLKVYEGTVAISITVPETMRDAPVRMRLQYQACSEWACLSPVGKLLEVRP